MKRKSSPRARARSGSRTSKLGAEGRPQILDDLIDGGDQQVFLRDEIVVHETRREDSASAAMRWTEASAMPCLRIAARKPSMIWLRRGPARLGRPIDSLVTKPIYLRQDRITSVAADVRARKGAPNAGLHAFRHGGPFATVRRCSPRDDDRLRIAEVVPLDSGRRWAGRACRRSSSEPPAAIFAASGATRRTPRGIRRESGGRSTNSSLPCRRRRVTSWSRAASRLLWSNLPRLTAALRGQGRARHDRDRGDRLSGARVRPDVGVPEARELRPGTESSGGACATDHAARRLDPATSCAQLIDDLSTVS